VTIRRAVPADVPEILAHIRALAEFEREPDAVINTPELLHAVLFGPDPKAFAYVIDGDEPGTLDAIAIWYLTYSTWTGTHGIHLEDLHVRPEARRRGHGRALLARLAQDCVDNGWARLEWNVLDWNAAAIGFYESMGAGFQDSWRTCRLDGDALSVAGRSAALGGRA
jgi:ribosomal protein S18 acetylase RimI-like enzyme